MLKTVLSPSARFTSTFSVAERFVRILLNDPQRTVVLSDEHVLDCLPGSCHVHGVGQVCPSQAGVGHLVLQHLVGPEADITWDVVILGGHRQGGLRSGDAS